MKLITTDEQLRSHLPNVIATVKGETPFIERLALFLDLAEDWVKTTFTSESTFNTICGYTDNNNIKILCSRLVVVDALRRAIPSLDLVLTPNGFGIVSNTNVAPASKDRVERLMDSLLDMRDKAVEQLLNQLPLMQSWTASAQCRWFTATLFPNIDLVLLCGFTEHRWEKYLELRSKILDSEDSLAEEYFSHELMAVLRHQALATSANESYAWIVARMKPQIVDFIHDKPINQRKMIDIVNFIRNNPEEFPEWHNSDTAKLFSPPIFENKKENKGYWF